MSHARWFVARHEEHNRRLLRMIRSFSLGLQLWKALQILLDEHIDDAAVRQQTFVQIPRARVLDAGAQVEALARPPDDHYYPELVERYRRVRHFLPTLLRIESFDGTHAGQPVLTALAFLAQIEHQHHPDMQQAPLDLVPSAWRRLVLPRHQPEADRRAYTLCAMERLQDSPRRRDVFMRRSERWGDPHLKLLHGTQWETMRPQVCRALGRSESPEPVLHALAQQLDCLVPGCDGVLYANFPSREALWDSYYTGVPGTTAAVRRAIQQSQESIVRLAERYTLNPKTVAKWKKRTHVHDAPMGPKQLRSTILTPEEEALIVAFRKHTLLPLDDCLYALQATLPDPIRAASLPSAAWHQPLAGHGRR